MEQRKSLLRSGRPIPLEWSSIYILVYILSILEHVFLFFLTYISFVSEKHVFQGIHLAVLGVVSVVLLPCSQSSPWSCWVNFWGEDTICDAWNQIKLPANRGMLFILVSNLSWPHLRKFYKTLYISI